MTIFTRIIKGEIPSHKVYEDSHVYAFLDINPVARGHTLVVPKEPAVTLGELSDEAAAAVGRVMPRICRAVQKATGCGAYNVLQNNGVMAGQAVGHVHFHVIPKYERGAGFSSTWPSAAVDHAAAGELAKVIAAEMATTTA